MHCSFDPSPTDRLSSADLSRARRVGVADEVFPTKYLGLSRLYRRMDKREQFQEHLTTATTYRDMGMTYWLEKAETEMRELK
jgi:hypothetical protein